MRTPEARDAKDDIKKWLTVHGWYWFAPVQMGYGKRILDLYACTDGGLFIAVECKKKKGKAEAFQDKIIKEIRATGGVAFVATSIEEFINQLERNGITW